jgi:hypothetical protein
MTSDLATMMKVWRWSCCLRVLEPICKIMWPLSGRVTCNCYSRARAVTNPDYADHMWVRIIVLWDKSVPLPLCTTWISHGLLWARMEHYDWVAPDHCPVGLTDFMISSFQVSVRQVSSQNGFSSLPFNSAHLNIWSLPTLCEVLSWWSCCTAHNLLWNYSTQLVALHTVYVWIK